MEPATGDGERLQKVLAHAGVASRRAVEDMIRARRVTVNDHPARLGERVDPSKDVVKVDGSRVLLTAELEHYLVNKPAGVVTSARAEAGRPTVLELVGTGARVWPVGRLDVDSEGALIVTNDGELTHRLTHPRFGVRKTYVVEVAGDIDPRAVRALTRGVDLPDGRARALEARILAREPHAAMVEVVMGEGRNREVRRMFAALGGRVRRLVRVAIGPVRLGRLKPGTHRKLSREEVRALYRACGM